MGQVGAAIVTSKLLQRFRPKLIVMPGICAGISDSTNIGDVIVGEECWAWDTGKLVGEQNGGLLQSGFQPAPHSYKADDFLISRFREMCADNGNMNNLEFGWRGMRPEQPPTLRVGPIATGSSVIANSNIRELIRSINRKTLAVEMEAYAVYATAQSYGQPSPRVLAVKSVCDHADDFKNDNWQQYCAFLSAKTIEAWLLKFGCDLD